jgi:hypothetical protein
MCILFCETETLEGGWKYSFIDSPCLKDRKEEGGLCRVLPTFHACGIDENALLFSAQAGRHIGSKKKTSPPIFFL